MSRSDNKKYDIKKEDLYRFYAIDKLTKEEIANKYGCSIPWIHKLLSQYKFLPKRKDLSKILPKEELYDLHYIQNKSPEEIGEIFNYGTQAVRKLMKTYKIKIRPEPTLTESISREDLFQLRHNENKSSEEIAKVFNCSAPLILNLLRMYDIHKNKRKHEDLTKEQLCRLYIEENKTAAEIGKMYNCSKSVVVRLLREFKLNIKLSNQLKDNRLSRDKLYDYYIIQGKSAREIAESYGCHASYIERLLSDYAIKKFKKKMHEIIPKDELIQLYYNEGLPMSEIAKVYNCCTSSVENVIRRHGLKGRVRDDYIKYGHLFEAIVKEIFESLNYEYIYQYKELDGIRPDFYDKENNTVLDAKLSSFTAFNASKSFFKKYAICNKVIIVYLRGNSINYEGQFEWRHISYYYPELIAANRQDLINKVINFENELSKISNSDQELA